MLVLAVVDDLLFQSKIEAAALQAGVAVNVARDRHALLSGSDHPSWALTFIDLELIADDPLAVLTHVKQLAPSAPVIGFCSHGDVELQERARQAGCDVVMPRSAFVRELPQLLQPPSSAPR